ncbi:MAG: YhcH/YjgK/YiaL family protein [Ginsengibacter sp.]
MDAEEFAKQYRRHKTYWDKAFAFLKDHNLKKIALGKYAIDGDDVFASVTDDATKVFDKTNWESHRKYIDLQYVIAGEEKIGICPVSKTTVIKPYDGKRDAANYTAEGRIYIARP